MKKKFFSFFLLTAFLLFPLAAFAENPLPSPKDANKSAAMHNDVGISHYNKGHWDVAAKHFKEALDADAKFAVAHYNLALSLDKGGKHGAAAKHFQTAYDLAPDNKEIRSSKILLAHIGK